MSLEQKHIWYIIATFSIFLFGCIFLFYKNDDKIITVSNANLMIPEEQPGALHGEEPVPLAPEPEKWIKIYVTGAVHSPGVYELLENSRIEDAITAAGGATEEADLLYSYINLAAFLYDGQHVIVPMQGEIIEITADEPGNGAININAATASALEQLPNIGPVGAQNICQYRETNGPFKKIEDIMNVPGIGEKTFQMIRDNITV